MEIISPLLIDSGEFFEPELVQERFLSMETLSDGGVFPIIALEGLVSGIPVSTELLNSFELYFVSIATEQDVSLEFIDDGNIFPVNVSSRVIITDWDLDGLMFYDVVVSNATSLAFFEDSLVYSPSVLSSDEIRTVLFSDSQFYDISVDKSSVEVSLDILDFSFVYPIISTAPKILPIRLKFAETSTGGSITNNLVASFQDYYTKPTDLDNRSQFRYSPITVLKRYIPSNEALFSKVFYAGFYIKNDSSSDRENVEFWVDGGLSYRIDSSLVNEARFLLEEAENGNPLPDRDRILLSGNSRTSLFGQINVEYLFAPERDLFRFNESGVGIGVNLPSQRFTPGYESTRVPVIRAGEYLGVYLRVTTKFLPDFPIKKDYSFFHLAYKNPVTGFREQYPGQVRSESGQTSLILPSLYMEFETSYDYLQKELDADVERVYSKYPPYFAPLEDSYDA